LFSAGCLQKDLENEKKSEIVGNLAKKKTNKTGRIQFLVGFEPPTNQFFRVIERSQLNSFLSNNNPK
jgi:hypothetical protein